MITPAELAKIIIEAVRARAKELDSFDRSTACVRIAISPISHEAREWIQNVVPNEAIRYEIIANLNPHNHTTRDMYECGCSDGCNALKITNCIRNILFGLGTTSHTPKEAAHDYIHPGNGLLNSGGCVSCLLRKEIYEGHDHPDTLDWARIYISVSGGHQEDDNLCARSGVVAIYQVFNYTEFTIS
jgi:hypothetical protein